MTAFDLAFNNVQTLVQTFDKDYYHYMSLSYSEADARKDFIDKFFIALGWDIHHDTQTNPYEQEVKVERSQKQQNESARKRADYAFFLAPNFRDEVFFVEAKKPSVLIQNNPQHYFQTQRYGWNAGCPVSALTDFEEFVIIDCRSKPDIRFSLNGKHKSYRYTDYADKEKFGEIYWLFSREAVTNNSIQKYAASLPKAKGKVIQKALFKGAYQAIDDSFLEYLDGIRENLAKAFKKNDDSLDSEQLTEAVQRTLDRLVFIRFLEDKFIEADDHVNEWQSWKDFISDCRKLDAKYNGVVFKKHFIDEQHFAGAEERLFIDICQDISSLNSPYDFNYIPIHILGSIYERFLGKVVVATAKRVHIDEKPEVRKAGGVYYTPKYIVDYIVQNTVGKLIQGKTPKQIAELRFADIACGSGSFLIGVFDALLDYHKKYFVEKLKDKTEIDKRSEDYGFAEYRDKQWQITRKLKQEILLNNIYGVDIDAQAVEVTQLSLFLKMLEDESINSIGQIQLVNKVLPDLSKNIICGNSLIGFDIMQMNGGLFEDEELKKINPMDYKVKFPLIMSSGGFDAVVGNPPYGRLLGDLANSYTSKQFPSFKTTGDVYVAFIIKALEKLKNNGSLSYIIPSSWLGGVAYKSFRVEILNKEVNTIISLPFDVFKDAYVDTVIVKLTNNETNSKHKVNCFSYPKKQKLESIEIIRNQWNSIPQSNWNNTSDKKFILSLGMSNIDVKLKANIPTKINDFIEMKRGVLFEKTLLTSTKTSANSFKYFEGNVYRYELNENCPSWIEYGTKMKEFPKEFKWFENERMLMRRLVNRQQRLMTTIAEHTFITNKNLYSLRLKSENKKEGLPAYLGILNSKLISRLYLEQVSQASKDDFPQVTIKDVLGLPMPMLTTKEIKYLSSFVTQMLQAKQQQPTAKTDKDKNFIDNKIQSLDSQIDQLVYELYGLTEEEIKIIELV